MSVAVRRYKRRKNVGDPTSPELNYLKQEPGSSKVFNIESLAREIETIGAMSADDVIHVMRAFVRRLKFVLTEGNRVKVDGLGTFFISFNCDGTENEKDCTVKNIRKVNIRFAVDNTLRLANDSTATTRGGDNNVQFYIKSDQSVSSAPSNGGDGDDDDFIDPTT